MKMLNLSPLDLVYVQFFLLVVIWLLLAAIYGMLGVIRRQKSAIDWYAETLKAAVNKDRYGFGGAIPSRVVTVDATSHCEGKKTIQAIVLAHDTVDQDVERCR